MLLSPTPPVPMTTTLDPLGTRAVFTTAPRLHESRRRWNPATYYLPNVADYSNFSRALDMCFKAASLIFS